MSIRSMTGFGRGVQVSDDGFATVEIASVNRKQMEVLLSLPRELSCLDSMIRKLVMQDVSRGRLQVTITYSQAGVATTPLRIDDALAMSLDSELRRISALIGRTLEPRVRDFLAVPGLLQKTDACLDCDMVWQVVEKALNAALAAFHRSRLVEGAALEADLLARMLLLEQEWSLITAKAPGRAVRHAEMLQKRLAELACPIDLNDERLLKEIAIFADRSDVSEEITRLQSHFGAFRGYLTTTESSGRALDFLCQEIHREWNTIGSKAADSDIAQAVVRAKAELEKMREQVQNAE